MKLSRSVNRGKRAPGKEFHRDVVHMGKQLFVRLFVLHLGKPKVCSREKNKQKAWFQAQT